MLVDAVIRKWETMVIVEEEVPDGFGWAIQWLAEIFYANAGIIALNRPARLQAALDVLMGLFDRFPLQTNVDKRLGWCAIPDTSFSGNIIQCKRGG